MKEATGDMTMTIVVIVSVMAILAIAPTIWNVISGKIQQEVNGIDTPNVNNGGNNNGGNNNGGNNGGALGGGYIKLPDYFRY